MEGINVLSLFDGMSCGQIALNKAGINITNYFASEIDLYAIKVTQHNFPNTVQIGSVTEVKGTSLPKIDLLIGGSPCQGFSFSGKQLNFDDPRSKLFFDYVRVLNELRVVNPDVKFLLENVRMKKEYQDVISSYLGVEPIAINSSLVSGQNRYRLYWTNIENVSQPKDKGIYLSDIIEENVDDKYYLSEKALLNTKYCNKDKVKGFREHSEKATCLTATSYKGFGNDGVTVICGAAQRGRNIVNGVRKDELGAKTIQRVELNLTGKSNCITTVNKDSLLVVHNNLRRLTPVECERLQTVDDNYTRCVSDSQRYRMLGNGWTVDVISHILSGIKDKLYNG